MLVKLVNFCFSLFCIFVNLFSLMSVAIAVELCFSFFDLVIFWSHLFCIYIYTFFVYPFINIKCCFLFLFVLLSLLCLILMQALQLPYYFCFYMVSNSILLLSLYLSLNLRLISCQQNILESYLFFQFDVSAFWIGLLHLYLMIFFEIFLLMIIFLKFF